MENGPRKEDHEIHYKQVVVHFHVSSRVYALGVKDYKKNGLTRGPDFGNFLYFSRSKYSRTGLLGYRHGHHVPKFGAPNFDPPGNRWTGFHTTPTGQPDPGVGHSPSGGPSGTFHIKIWRLVVQPGTPQKPLGWSTVGLLPHGRY